MSKNATILESKVLRYLPNINQVITGYFLVTLFSVEERKYLSITNIDFERQTIESTHPNVKTIQEAYNFRSLGEINYEHGATNNH